MESLIKLVGGIVVFGCAALGAAQILSTVADWRERAEGTPDAGHA